VENEKPEGVVRVKKETILLVIVSVISLAACSLAVYDLYGNENSTKSQNLQGLQNTLPKTPITLKQTQQMAKETTSTLQQNHQSTETTLKPKKSETQGKVPKEKTGGGGKKSKSNAVDVGSGLVGTEIIGLPTDKSITFNLVAVQGMQAYFEYGIKSGEYTGKTRTYTSTAGGPIAATITGLLPDTLYYYQTNYLVPGQTSFKSNTESTFRTQRASGSTFTFAVQGDSHPERAGKMFNSDLYLETMKHVASEKPDFYFTLGDDFSIENLISQGPLKQESVDKVYLYQRNYLGLIGRTSPLFLVNGNHEQAAKYLLDGRADNAAVLAGKSRIKYYPLPAPDSFYGGDSEEVQNVGLLRDYYSFVWADALFVVIDPYWHSGVAVDNVAGGAEGKRADLWSITLGDTQYQWFKKTLEESNAKYKFVFTHHVLGTGRGGIENANLYEWGGYGKNGVLEFDKMRPTWDKPIHQLMADNKVSIFFQGHDHLFAKQEKDGVVYQSCPNPADDTYQAFNSNAYSGDILPNSGHLLVTVSPQNVKVDYIRSFLPQDETDSQKDGEVAYSYDVS
jgi:hypothetical protein